MGKKFHIKGRRWLYLPVLAGLAAIAPVEAEAAPLVGSGMAQQAASETTGIVTVAERRRSRRSTRTGSRRRTVVPSTTAASVRAGLRANKLSGSTNQLFGTVEKKSTTFTSFKKWNGVVDKMAKEHSNLDAFKKRFKDWIKVLDTLKGKDALTQIKAVNKLMNQSKYIQDNKNWGIKDYWASPGEFLNKFGDCEDYSIAKYMALKYLGHDAEKMRIVAVRDMNLKVGHAILAYYFDDKIVILDNQIKIVVDSRKVRHYQPVYSINEAAWWRHRPAV